MIDSVLIDPETFQGMIFKGARERKKYVEGQNVPDDEKEQQHKDGVPVWTVELTVQTWRVDRSGRHQSRDIKVNVPSPDNPADRFEWGTPVRLEGLTFGVTAKREKCQCGQSSGYILWLTANSIEAAANARKSHVASAA